MPVSEMNAVVSEIRIAAPPETVFAFFVDPAKMVRWMGARAELDGRPGGMYAVDINPHARARGEYVEVVPPSRVVFTFGWEDDQAVPPGSTAVEVTLTPDGAGTHVRLIHRGLTAAEIRAQHEQGWQQYVARLAIAAGGGEPGPDPNGKLSTQESAEYVAARQQLQLAEIELMRQRERVAELRRQLPPGVAIADYVFEEGPARLDDADAPVRRVRLSELFTAPGRSLVVYHLMFGKEQTSPCPMCTMWIDGFNGVAQHLAQNLDFVVVAAADVPELRAHARARGWQNLRLLSCGTNTFKYDFGSEDEHGNQDSTISVFIRGADGTIRHFYSAHPRMAEDIDQRGIDLLSPVWNIMDLTPVGRGEWYADLSYPEGPAQAR